MSSAFYRICQDGHVYPADKKGLLPTIYYIETCLIPERTTNCKYEYYTSFVQDSERQRVPDNTLEWNGVKCRLDTRDDWEIGGDAKKEFSIDGIVLVAYITDSKGKERKVLFNNNIHNGQAWIKLMDYVREVQKIGSHQLIEKAKQLRMV
jgi:hypothetical protein